MALDYFPLKANTRYEYRYKSSEFEGIAKVYIDIISVSRKTNKTVAKVKMTFELRDTNESEYKITRDKKWIITGDGVIIGGRKEFPLPPKEGIKWNEYPDLNEIVSMTDKVSVKAGKFRHCMKVVSMLAGGDTGKSVRYYAPGIGYILEKYSAEDKTCETELVAVGTIPKEEK